MRAPYMPPVLAGEENSFRRCVVGRLDRTSGLKLPNRELPCSADLVLRFDEVVGLSE